MKHTPGPWTLDHVPTAAGSAFVIGCATDGRGRAWIYADNLRKGIDDELPASVNMAANARLIAAAPDLLDALQECANRLQIHMKHTEDLIAHMQAHKAIAKATGSAE